MRCLQLFGLSIGLSLLPFLHADNPQNGKTEKENSREVLKEELVTTSHTVTIDGVSIPYKATAGKLPLKDNKGEVKGSIFFVAYTKDGQENPSKRPITFCFNGGPGSSAVWLNIGILGPRRIEIDELKPSSPPYTLVDNNESILDVTDLVFIDPISTGYSITEKGVDPKTYHGVDEDIKSMGEFIRLFTTKFERWDSPKFMCGESYGTTRVAGLLDHLDDQCNMDFNGAILVSAVLNYQTVWDYQGGNDLPYSLALPTFTNTAGYYKLLPEELQKDLTKARKEAERFAMNEYTLALMKGDSITPEEKGEIVEKLAQLTGLSKAYIERSNLRIGSASFAQELLKGQLRTTGRFDSRMLGIDYDPLRDQISWDPSFHAIMGPFTAAYQQYLRSELNWKEDGQYVVLANVWPWDFGKNNQYLNIAVSLSEVMSRNPYLKVFVAAGMYDLATPYFTVPYTLDHLNLDPSLKTNIKVIYYPAGHMMYLAKSVKGPFKNDVKTFIQDALKKR